MNKMRTLLIVTTAIVLSACANMAQFEDLQPTARIDSTRLLQLSVKQADLMADITIDNPTPLTIPIDAIAMKLMVNNETIVRSQATLNARVRGNQATTIELPFGLPYTALVGASESLRQANALSYSLEGEVTLATGITLPISFSGILPVPQPPRFGLEDVRLESLSLSQAVISPVVTIDNPNIFPLTLQDMAFVLLANENALATLVPTEDISVPGGESLQVPLSTAIDLRQAGRLLYSSLFNGEAVDWQLSGAADIFGIKGLSLNDQSIEFGEFLSASPQ